MAIQNDNTLVTKGDLKSLYTDKIAPYLGGGISYYYTDRTGEELKSIDMRLSASQAVNAGSTQNTLINFDKSSGTYETNNHKVIIPAGQRIQINVALQASPGASNAVDGEWQIYDYTNDIIISKANFTYIGSGYSWSSTKSVQYTAPENGALVGVKVTALFYNTSVTASSSFTIQEIGRIVDPVKYVSNNSDLQETPVGNIISYMGNSVPKHYLACDGATYSIGAYPELEAFIIDEFGSVNYFGGDGSTTWAVPDLRGEFLRGTGTNGHTNQGNGANVGTHQDATMIPYMGVYNTNSTAGSGVRTDARFRTINNTPFAPQNTDSYDIGNANVKYLAMHSSFVYETTDNTWAEYTSRPTNTSVKYCIKYESTFHAFFNNAAYKVSVGASVGASTNTEIAVTLNNSDIIGDASLISGNYFIAPINGIYSIGCNWTCHGQFDQDYYFEINEVGMSASKQIGLSNTLYLSKGDKVRLIKYNGAANEGRVNFCLLTSNYNPTIVSADTVYSENEQMIGYWTDGKPLYQKTVNFGALPNATTKNVPHGISNLDYVVEIYGVSSDGSIQAYLPYVNPASLSNAVSIKINGSNIQIVTASNMSTFTKTYVTIQYTKTTDTASTLQVENSLLLNRPDLWEVGREYSFGGGLYGQRYTGTAKAGTNAKTVLDATLKGTIKIVSCGGNIDYTSGQVLSIPYSDTGTFASIQKTASDGLILFGTLGSSASRVFDIWITYKK